jgi:hypothetical protein
MLIGASETTAGIHWAVPNPPMSTEAVEKRVMRGG